MDTQTLIEFLNDEDTYRCSWGFPSVDTTFETMPSEFIEFAENDLQSSLDHKYINALSNAKRALDCQADRLLKVFGYYKESQKKFWGFPKKVEIIQKFDILAPRVLTKINRTRNLMEHQYVKPNAEQVEDFLDIVSLFIASTEHHTSSCLLEVSYENDSKCHEKFKDYSSLDFKIDSENSKLIIKGNKFISKEDGRQPFTLSLETTDTNYSDVFKYHLKKIEFR